MSFLRRQESYALNQSFDRSTQYLNVIVINFVDCQALIIYNFPFTNLPFLLQVNQRGRGRKLYKIILQLSFLRRQESHSSNQSFERSPQSGLSSIITNFCNRNCPLEGTSGVFLWEVHYLFWIEFTFSSIVKSTLNILCKIYFFISCHSCAPACHAFGR